MYAKNSSQKLCIFALELVEVNLVSRSAMISMGTPFPSEPSTTWLTKSSATILPSDFFHVGRHLTFLRYRLVRRRLIHHRQLVNPVRVETTHLFAALKLFQRWRG